MKQLFLASNNKGKQKEFKDLLSAYSINLKCPQDLLSYQEPEETADTFLENALIKARYGAKVSGLPCLADDSGLCLPVLNGAPGVYSARYSGSSDNECNKQKLIQELKNIPETERNGFFCCVLVLMQHEHDPMPLVFQGLWSGQILTEEQGEDGFGYDPLFYLPEHHKTAAQLGDLKNKLSHRAQALQQLFEFLEKHPSY